MSTLLSRLGRACALHPWRTVAAWVVVLVAALGAAAQLGAAPHDNYDTPGTESTAATAFLRESFPQSAGDEARVVLHRAGAPLEAATVEQVRERTATLDGVSTVSPRWSADGRTALLVVQYSIPVTDFAGTEGVDALRAAAGPATDAGVQVELGGLVAEDAQEGGSSAELIGLAVAAVVLLLAFGSVLAAGLPLLVALFGLGVGSAGITLLAAVTDISTSAPFVAAMVGIGVGIDYALLLLTRFTEHLHEGRAPVDAAADANAEAGTSVVFAGATVLLSLLGLGLSGLPVFTSFGYATGLVVLCVVLTAITLVPALCGAAGHRLLGRAGRRRARAGTTPLSARWAVRVSRRPVAWGLAALTLLLLLAAPALAMRTWPQDAGSGLDSQTTRRAYDLVEAGFGPGANGPLVVAVDLRDGRTERVAQTVTALQSTPGIAQVAPPVLNQAGTAALVQVQPSTSPQDPAAAALIRHLRADVLEPGVMVTGTTAVFADIADKLAVRLWVVISFVVAVSVLALVVVFRSVPIALKAAALNLLSVGAAYGVLTMVFQWGWGATLLGLPHATPVSTWVPILLFTVLFGLSMDYEVFLVSRIRREWLRTGDAAGSVHRGIGATGRVITCAALIMVSVFLAFATDTDLTVKMVGVGMATAIAVDATVVRMVLLPSVMVLLGERAWWLPAWLDSRLPGQRKPLRPAERARSETPTTVPS
ncbi:MMPL family transporter [Rhodococcus sp. X156]|uniref:MMPL family transporter n=1 Tax=Rhodococcus sp. X156 TaxID=2499145 RepID=UPI000FD71249|nr:MMPL family transporter [Rhodococcus sp. X156]